MSTPNLWTRDTFGLVQFELPDCLFPQEAQIDSNQIRLGKRVEQFFEYTINHSKNYKLIASNIQVKNEKLTIGELDALVKHSTSVFHIEIVYKFYLYDSNVNGDMFDKWIGPNRKDTLIYKLKKLKEKQLPLLYSPSTTPILDQLGLLIDAITQNVLYKAQLFLPYELKIDISPLNPKAIYGFYFNIEKLKAFKLYTFYLPSKMDWLVIPHLDVDWLNYDQAKTKIDDFIIEKRSPMVWLKNENNKLSKAFITFW